MSLLKELRRSWVNASYKHRAPPELINAGLALFLTLRFPTCVAVSESFVITQPTATMSATLTPISLEREAR